MNTPSPYFRASIDLKKVGEWFRRAREDMHLSVREAAKLSGISASQVARMEIGEDFTMAKLVQLAVPLGFPPAILIDNSLTIDRSVYDPGGHASLNTLAELDDLANVGRSYGHIATSLGLLDLVETVGACACQLLLSANPRETLRSLKIPYPSLVRRFEGFLDAYGLETETTERAAVYRALTQKPVRKLRALGLLAGDVIDEFLKHQSGDEDNLTPVLKIETDSAITQPVPDASSSWSQLVQRTAQVTGPWGAKTRLARDLGVTPQAVNHWLTGTSAPSAETTLRLLQWVTAAEAEQNTRPTTE